MSVDLNWEAVTGGSDGRALEVSIRDFIHAKFQAISLPGLIKSVTVHDFQFGTIPPELELKDITDPLPDFYEETSGAGDEEEDEEGEEVRTNEPASTVQTPDETRAESDRGRANEHVAPPPHAGGNSKRDSAHLYDLGSPFLGVSTPGIPGGTSNLHYFHSHFAGNGLSGTHTPLAAVASAQHHRSNNSRTENALRGAASLLSMDGSQAARPGGEEERPKHIRHRSHRSLSVGEPNPSQGADKTPVAPDQGLLPFDAALRQKHSVSTLAPTLSSRGTSRPPTRDPHARVGSGPVEDEEDDGGARAENAARRFREPRPDDMQAVFRIKYAGDVKLLLTADILLDYPMPSFVGIPVQLSITGLTFDGVGVLAYIRKRVHFCFLSPEDALAAVGPDAQGEGGREEVQKHGRVGGLLQEIKVESEIGQRESGKQSLKNVGKVERFVLEQVRRIFEEEFVYPSFWTFLV